MSRRSSGCDSRAAIAKASAEFPASNTVQPASRSTCVVSARTPLSSSTISKLPLAGACGSTGWLSSHSGSGDAVAGATAGNSTVKRAPCAGVLCTCTSPPLCLTTPYTVASPRPVPRPERLGGEERLEHALENPRRDALAGIFHDQRRVGPAPGPGPPAPFRGSISTLWVRRVSRPPRGMASRAFTTRFTITCSSCDGSAHTGLRSGASCTTRSMCSPISRRSIF